MSDSTQMYNGDWRIQYAALHRGNAIDYNLLLLQKHVSHCLSHSAFLREIQ